MKYDNYEQKIQRLAKLLKPIFKHLIKITVFVSVVLMVVATLLATKGILVVGAADYYSSEILYGEELKYQAKAFLSNVEYEYSPADREEWTKEFPKDPGEYKVRAVAKATFGYRYSEAENFTIKPRPVTLKIESDIIYYGNEPAIVADLFGGDKLAEASIIYHNDKTVAQADVQSVKIIDENGQDITSRYDITAEQREIQFVKRPITIATASDSKVYDGVAIADHKYTITNGSVAEGDRLEVLFSASLTNVGEVENIAEIKILNKNGVDVTDCYDLTQNNGKLTINPRPITIVTGSYDVIYDGWSHFFKKYHIDGQYGLADNHSVNVNSWAKITNVGTTPNIMTFCIQDENGNIVTSNYDISCNFGSLTVIQRKITVLTESATLIYDGTPHYYNELILGDRSLSLCDGHYFDNITYTTFKNVIENAENRVEFIITDGSKDVSANYAITYEYGTVNILPRPITVVTSGYNGVYDGVERSLGLWLDPSKSGYMFCPGHSFENVIYPTFKNVVENAENRVEFIIWDGTEDVTSNYDISYEYGLVNILPRPITIVTEGYNEVYDGVERSFSWWLDTSKGGYELAFGQYFDNVSVPTFKNVIENAENHVEFIITDGSEDVTSNYDITYEYGIVTILPRPITIVTEGYNEVYDGVERSFSWWLDTSKGGYELAFGQYFDNVSVPTFKNVIENAENRVEFIITDGSEDVTSNYNITYEYGIVTILPRPITIVTEGYNEVYDGVERSFSWWLDTSNGGYELASGQYFDNVSVPAFKNVIENAENRVEFIITDGSEDVTSNYDITYEYGIVTILPRPITVVTGGYYDVYDGIERIFPIWIDTSDGGYDLCDGHFLNNVIYPTFKNVIENAENRVEFIITDRIEDVTANYDITYECGIVTILPRPITIVTDGYYGVYDGIERSFSWWLDTSRGGYDLCDGHYLINVFYSTFKNVIENAENRVEFIIYDEIEDVTDNYDITYEYGIVNILHRPITIVTEGYYGVYDGIERSFSWWLDTSEGGYDLAFEQYFDNVTVPAFKNVIENAENRVEFIITDGIEDVTDNYAITYKCGKVTIIKRLVKIQTESKSWLYDGEVHSHPEYSLLDGTTFVDFHTVKIKTGTVASIRDAGTVENLWEFVVFDEEYRDCTYNYDIQFAEVGILEVIKRHIAIYSESDKKKYDGTPLEKHSIKLSPDSPDSLLDGNEMEVDFSGSITEVGVADNTFDIQSLKIYNESGEDITNNYEVDSYYYGTLTVTGEDDEGGGGGGGSGSLDLSGNIGAPENADFEAQKQTVALVVTTDTTGKLYLKIKSFGSYSGQSWGSAAEYDSLILEDLSAYYLTSLALSKYGLPVSYIKIVSKTGEYVLPYYAIDKDCPIQTSDVLVSGDASEEYYLYYYSWDFENGMVVPEGLEAFEAAYSEFVHDQYLDIDEITMSYMQNIINAQHWSADDPDIINKVARYIKSAATYSLEYDRALDQSANIVIAFLSEYREGICQHYASAGTMLFRALGIPARYTGGYTVFAEAHQETEVTAFMAHAWVEVYIDGLGWVPVEVTGSSSDSELEDGGIGEGDEGSGEDEMERIVIKPTYQFKKYDGTPLIARNEIQSDYTLDKLLAQGYTFEVLIEGEQTEVGTGVSVVRDFVLWDPYHNDVTDQFIIEYRDGVLSVSQNIIKIYIYQKNYEYNANPYSYDRDDYFVIEIEDGLALEILDINVSREEVGFITASEINENIDQYIKYAVYKEGSATDISQNYQLVVVNYGTESDYNVMSIKPRQLIITTGSARQEYNGKELTDDSFYISTGSVAEGHKIHLDVIGYITERGMALNIVDKSSFSITDKSGEDVTHNYEVDFVLGTLEVV